MASEKFVTVETTFVKSEVAAGAKLSTASLNITGTHTLSTLAPTKSPSANITLFCISLLSYKYQKRVSIRSKIELIMLPLTLGQIYVNMTLSI